jgi:RNA polymerase sigma-B factor
MVASAPVLLREWELLQNEVVPLLLEIEQTRSPRSWSIGSIEDAVAVGVAFQHAQSSAPAAEAIELYAAPGRPAREVGFALADLRCVPRESQAAYFVRHDRRWIVDDQIAEHVVLGDPLDAVDLVTLRHSAGDGDRRFDAALDQLAPGGRLLLIGPSDVPLRLSDGIDAVEVTPAGRVYCKRSTSRLQPCTKARSRSGGEPAETLARHRAQEMLVSDHVRLARSLARRFAHHGEPTEDLEQVALLALVKAAKRFDPSRDTRFASYAASSILGELKRHFRDKAWMLRVPRPVQELYLSVKQARDELTHSLGASPTARQIADCIETTESAVLDAMGAGDNFWPASLDGRTRDEPATEVPVVDGALDQSLDRLQVQLLLPRLEEREHLVLRRIYFDNCAQREIAAELGLSQMQVSRVLARALSKLRS